MTTTGPVMKTISAIILVIIPGGLVLAALALLASKFIPSGWLRRRTELRQAEEAVRAVPRSARARWVAQVSGAVRG